jgi:hypothetical protein
MRNSAYSPPNQSKLREAKNKEWAAKNKGLGGILRAPKAFKAAATPLPQLGDGGKKKPRLSSKDIVEGDFSFEEVGFDKVMLPSNAVNRRLDLT